jgi:hypothetical protein
MCKAENKSSRKVPELFGNGGYDVNDAGARGEDVELWMGSDNSEAWGKEAGMESIS